MVNKISCFVLDSYGYIIIPILRKPHIKCYYFFLYKHLIVQKNCITWNTDLFETTFSIIYCSIEWGPSSISGRWRHTYEEVEIRNMRVVFSVHQTESRGHTIYAFNVLTKLNLASRSLNFTSAQALPATGSLYFVYKPATFRRGTVTMKAVWSFNKI